MLDEQGLAKLLRVKRSTARDGSSARLTLSQWGDLAEDIEGELVEGQLEEEEVPSFIHEEVVGWLYAELRAWARPKGHRVYGSEAKVAVGARSGRKPDVSVYSREALPPGRASVAHVAPLIIAEVISATPRDERRDRIEKSRDYARRGVRYYWLVNPAARTFEIFELERSGRYGQALIASGGRLLRIPGCAGLKLNLDDLWRDVAAAESR